MNIVFFLFLGGVLGFFTGKIITEKEMQKKINWWERLSNIHLELYMLMTYWLSKKLDNKQISTYLQELGYKTVAIYGLSHAGKCLLQELGNSEIEVRYGIDRDKSKYRNESIRVIGSDEELEEVDAIIVTAVFHFEDIQYNLLKKTEIPIISLADIVLEL